VSISIGSFMNSNAFRPQHAKQHSRASAPADMFAASMASDSTSGSDGASGSGSASGGTSGSGTAGGDGSGDGAGQLHTWQGGLDLTQMPYDSITVTLPNGSRFGVFHFGGNVDQAAEDEMVKSVERLASSISTYSFSGAAAAESGAADAPPSEGSDAPPAQGTDAPPSEGGALAVDMVHIDLPNGTEIELRHATTGNETTDASQAAAEQMAKAAEELAAAFKAYAGASSSTAARDTSSGQLPPGLAA
jgi:hypothetical protein